MIKKKTKKKKDVKVSKFESYFIKPIAKLIIIPIVNPILGIINKLLDICIAIVERKK